jgi:hypothetical protein
MNKLFPKDLPPHIAAKFDGIFVGLSTAQTLDDLIEDDIDA